MAFLSSAKSFHFVSEDCQTEEDIFKRNPTTDLSIVRLPLVTTSASKHPSLLDARPPQNHLLGLVLAEWISQITVPILVNQISNFVDKDKMISAIVVRVEITPGVQADVDVIDGLLWKLNEKGVPCLLNFHHDNQVFDHVNFSLLSGIIVDNACILADGDRRDYFRSMNLRKVMTRCAGERLSRPGFFVGFHDTWEVQPSAAVVCRAAKVASHFEAILNHGPSQRGSPRLTNISGIGKSVSGIEYLRKPEISQVSFFVRLNMWKDIPQLTVLAVTTGMGTAERRGLRGIRNERIDRPGRPPRCH